MSELNKICFQVGQALSIKTEWEVPLECIVDSTHHETAMVPSTEDYPKPS